MDMEPIRKLIEKDELEEAIGLITADGKPSSNELTNILARLKQLNRQRDLGVISTIDYNQERNRIRMALLEYLSKPALPPGFQTSNRIRILLLSAVILVAVLAGLLSLFKENNVLNEESLNAIQSELQDRRFSFVRPNVSFSTEQQYKAGLAYLKRKYSWTADLPFFADTKALQLDYDREKNSLKVIIKKIQLTDNFTLRNQKAETLENSLWTEEKSMDGDFWANINSTTGILADVKLSNEENLRRSLFQTAEKGLQEEVQKLLAQKGLETTSVDIDIKTLELLSGQTIN